MNGRFLKALCRLVEMVRASRYDLSSSGANGTGPRSWLEPSGNAEWEGLGIRIALCEKVSEQNVYPRECGRRSFLSNHVVGFSLFEQGILFLLRNTTSRRLEIYSADRAGADSQAIDFAEAAQACSAEYRRRLRRHGRCSQHRRCSYSTWKCSLSPLWRSWCLWSTLSDSLKMW